MMPDTPNASHILYVESHDVFAEWDILTFEKAGFKVTWVLRAEEALSFIEQHGNPDILVTNLILSEMSGEQLIRIILRGETTKIIPIITITVMPNPINRIIAHLSGVKRYLIRPYQMKELSNAVIEALATKDMDE